MSINRSNQEIYSQHDEASPKNLSILFQLPVLPPEAKWKSENEFPALALSTWGRSSYCRKKLTLHARLTKQKRMD